MVYITPPNDSQSGSTNQVDSGHQEQVANKPTFLGLSDTLVENPVSEEVVDTASTQESFVETNDIVQTPSDESYPEEATAEPELARSMLPGGAVLWTTIVSLMLTAGLVIYSNFSGTDNPTVSKSDSDILEQTEITSVTTVDTEETQATSIEVIPDPTVVPDETSDVNLTEDDFTLPRLPSEAGNVEKEIVSETAPEVVDLEPAKPSTDYTNKPTSTDPLDFDPTAFDMALMGTSGDSRPKEAVTYTTNRPVSEAESIAMLPPAKVREKSTKVTILERNPIGVTAAETLAKPLPEIELKQIPLNDALGLFSNLTGTPLSTSPTALRHAAVDAGEKIDITGVGIPISEILNEALASVRLSLAADGQHGLVVRKGVEQESTFNHKLGDLTSLSDKHLLLFETYCLAPLQLDENGNASIRQPKRSQFDLLILTERLRLARGLPTTSKYPKRLLSVEPLYAQMASVLERKTTFNFVSSTRFIALMDHLSQATGLAVLVDWPALAEVDIYPNTTMTALADNCTWAEALDGILGELQLGWVPTDGKTLWITSKSIESSRRFTEFYPGMPRQKAESLANNYAEDIVVYDEPSRTTIVHAGSDAQRAAYQLWLSQ